MIITIIMIIMIMISSYPKERPWHVGVGAAGRWSKVGRLLDNNHDDDHNGDTHDDGYDEGHDYGHDGNHHDDYGDYSFCDDDVLEHDGHHHSHHVVSNLHMLRSSF